MPDNIYKSMSPAEDIFLKLGVFPRTLVLPPHPPKKLRVAVLGAETDICVGKENSINGVGF